MGKITGFLLLTLISLPLFAANSTPKSPKNKPASCGFLRFHNHSGNDVQAVMRKKASRTSHKLVLGTIPANSTKTFSLLNSDVQNWIDNTAHLYLYELAESKLSSSYFYLKCPDNNKKCKLKKSGNPQFLLKNPITMTWCKSDPYYAPNPMLNRHTSRKMTVHIHKK